MTPATRSRSGPLPKTSVDDAVAALDGLAAVGDVAVAMVDLDGFALLNDELGHESADRLLAGFERTLSGSISGDLSIHRIGGDEYVVIAPGESAESLLIQLDEVRAHAATKALDPDVGRGISLSIGVASKPPHAVTGADLLRAAHHALYRAKRDGGGRVSIYVEEKMVLKSNYYEPAMLHRLARLSTRSGRTEASLLREALDDLLAKHAD